MLAVSNSLIVRHLFLASGMVSHGSVGGARLDEGFGAILISGVLGAFCGLLAGLVISHLVRYFSFLMGRQVTGNIWTLVSVIVGAALFVLWTAYGDGQVSSLPATEGIAEN